MIYQLDCTREELASASRDELEDVFSRLVDADRAGRHFFIVRRDLCEWARRNLRLSRLDSARLATIKEEYAIRGALLEDSHVCVKVRIGNSGVRCDRGLGFSIGHECLVSGEYLLVSAGFVVEDLTSDGKVYDQILREALKVSKVPSYRVEFIHGGGSQVGEIFEAEIGKGRVVVCVVDHDRLAPMDSKSAGARQILLIQTQRNESPGGGRGSFIGLGTTTVGREVENHIPYHLIKGMWDMNYRHFAELDRIVAQVGCVRKEDCFWQYFDIKEGLCGEELMKLLGGEKISQDVIEWICGRVGCDIEELASVQIDGFGDRVVKLFLGSPQALAGFHEFVRSEYWQSMYAGFYERLLWFCAAPRAVRT